MTNHFSTRALVMLALWGSLAGCVAIKTVQPLSVSLEYKADPDNVVSLLGFSCPYLAHVQVVDKRSDTLLGVRYLESNSMKADVSAGNDPVPWAQGGVESYLGQNHLKLGGAGPTLVLELDSVKTAENILHRSGYEARLVFGATLRSPQGKTCWHADLQSDSGDDGDVGSIKVYREVLNRALDKVASQILNSTDFSNSLCHCAD